MMYWGPGFGWMGMMFGGLMMLLFWGVLIALAIIAFRAFTRPGGWQSRDANRTVERREDNALAILKERYAKGEISREQYQEMQDALSR